MTLLQKLHSERLAAREELRAPVRELLRVAPTKLLPRTKVIVFGSLTRVAEFGEFSDVDLALAAEPEKMSIYQLTALLAEELGRRVDLIFLPECRFVDL